MNKRTDTIRTLFAQSPQPPLSADNAPPAAPRIPAGSVRSLKDSFAGIEKENEELRARFAAGELIVELAPELIDPSPIADRFPADNDLSYSVLKQSIEENGQELPVVVRPHPQVPGRYQTAFGHRRIRVAHDLGRMVRAIVRALSDDELVIAQGVENSAREDLSFIERAMFAVRIEDAGRSRTIVQQALSIDRAEASKLITVARAIPPDIVRAIGRAPRVGRGRWQGLAECIADPQAVARVNATISVAAFRALDSDGRFIAVLTAATRREADKSTRPNVTTLSRSTGEPFVQVVQSERALQMTIDRLTHGAFASYLVERLPTLFDEFEASRTRGG